MWSRMTGRASGPPGPGPGVTRGAAPGQAPGRGSAGPPLPRVPGPGQGQAVALSQGQSSAPPPPPPPLHQNLIAPDTSEVVTNEPEQTEDREDKEDILEKFSKLDIRDQQILLDKMKKNTAQALYPSSQLIYNATQVIGLDNLVCSVLHLVGTVVVQLLARCDMLFISRHRVYY